jgi:putative lumazine-binding protein
MLQRRSSVALALGLVLALGGCATQGSAGGDSSTKFSGDKRQVAKVVEDFQSATTQNDQGKICTDLLAGALVRRLAQRAGSCTKAVDAAIKDADTFGLTVDSVRIVGNQATVDVTADIGNKDRRQTLTLTRQGPGWRISEFG